MICANLFIKNEIFTTDENVPVWNQGTLEQPKYIPTNQSFVHQSVEVLDFEIRFTILMDRSSGTHGEILVKNQTQLLACLKSIRTRAPIIKMY